MLATQSPFVSVAPLKLIGSRLSKPLLAWNNQLCEKSRNSKTYQALLTPLASQAEALGSLGQVDVQQLVPLLSVGVQTPVEEYVTV